MGLLNSHGVPRDPHYLGAFLKGVLFSLTGLSPSMARHIQSCSTKSTLCNLTEALYYFHEMSRDPISTTDIAFDILMVWAAPRSLAATDGIAKLLSVPPGTKMFQFSGLAFPTYVFSWESSGFA